jgi:hypothetical protein
MILLRHSMAFTLLLLLLVDPALADTTAIPSAKEQAQPVLPDAYRQIYAMVDGESELLVSFQDFYQYKRRNKYYHGQPPEAEYQTFVKTVRTEWLDQILLQHYLAKNNPDYTYDTVEVDSQVVRFDEQMQTVASWPLVRELYLKVYRQRLVRDLLYRAYQDKLRAETKLTEQEALAFYQQHPEKFTQPPRSRVSLILLAVDPSAGSLAWQEAKQQLDQVRFRLVNGEDFAETAAELSTDPTAQNGGDMGFVHEGSISGTAEEALTDIKPGEMTQVLTLLNGVAIFKLTERIPAEHHEFAAVKQRASDLALQNKQVSVWQDFIESLRKDAKIEILLNE